MIPPGVKTKFGRAQIYRYEKRIQEPKNPFERTVWHWGRDRRAQVYRYGPIPRELLVVTTDGVRCKLALGASLFFGIDGRALGPGP